MSAGAVIAVILVVALAAVVAYLFARRGKGENTAVNAVTPSSASLPAVSKRPTVSQVRAYDREAHRAALSCANAIKVAKAKSTERIDFSFMESQETLAREGERLESELQRHISCRLAESSFQVYAQLHFESMLAADRQHSRYGEACRCLDQVGTLLVAIGRGEIRVSRGEKEELYALKDAVKASRNAYLANTRLLNNQTHDLKVKIRDECGQRGRRWYAERERNAGR